MQKGYLNLYSTSTLSKILNIWKTLDIIGDKALNNRRKSKKNEVMEEREWTEQDEEEFEEFCLDSNDEELCEIFIDKHAPPIEAEYEDEYEKYI